MQLAKKVIPGLSLCEGFCIDDIRSRFGINVLAHYNEQVEDMVGSGMLEHSDRHITLTRHSRLLSNEVFCRFLPE